MNGPAGDDGNEWSLIFKSQVFENYLRSTMGEPRLNGLALLYVCPNVTVKPEDVLNLFAMKNKRRLEFVLWLT